MPAASNASFGFRVLPPKRYLAPLLAPGCLDDVQWYICLLGNFELYTKVDIVQCTKKEAT
jgi:hypothetical protein